MGMSLAGLGESGRIQYRIYRMMTCNIQATDYSTDYYIAYKELIRAEMYRIVAEEFLTCRPEHSREEKTTVKVK
jgi:hypothetical protein